MAPIIWIFLLIATLTGCTTITPTAKYSGLGKTTKPISAQERENILNRIENWHISGKVAVQTPKDSGSASINWTQRRQQYDLTLMGPLGAHGLILKGNQHRVALRTADGKTYYAKDPEQLLQERWGFNLPVSYLKYWVRGLPVPGLPAVSKKDAQGRLITLRQKGWSINFLSYTQSGRIDLPSRINIQSPEIRVKILIYHWNA